MDNDALERGGGPNFPERSWVGALIGDVLISEVLSQSAGALILLGTQEGIGRLAVVKLLPFSGDTQGTAEHRILKNAQVLSQLRHANIVTLYDVGLFEGRYPYLVTEHVRGGTLQRLIEEEGPLPPLRALGLMQQVAHALEDVHRQQLVHQNLRLSNVLVESLAGSDHDLAKLINFGLSGSSTSLGDPEDPQARPDKALLMTPEEGLGEDYSARSDLYLCGVMLFEILTGMKPYRTLELPALWDEIVSRRPIPLAEISPVLGLYPELQMLVDHMLSKNPTSRPLNARALRLMIGQVMVDVEQKDAAVVSRRDKAFPVLNTVERLPAIPKPPAPRPMPQSKVTPQAIEPKPSRPSASYKTPPDASKVPTSPEFQRLPPPRRPAGTVAPPSRDQREPPSRRVTLDRIDIDQVGWSARAPEDLPLAGEQPYLVLLITRNGEPLPPGFESPVEVLMSAIVDASTVMMAFRPPQHQEGWLSTLAAQAAEYGFRVGFSFGSRFDTELRKPTAYTVRMAVQAAQHAQVGELVAARHAVDALAITRHFAPVDSRLTGRYAMFMRYKTPNASD